MIKLYNMDNMAFETKRKANLIYCDMIYESLDLNWILKYWNMLAPDSIFQIQTDWHSVFEVGYFMKQLPNSFFLNHICWKNEFGNFPKNKFRQSHDDILIFSNSKDYKFYPERVQVPKATANSKGLNPSGRTTKLATSVWTDITLTTIAKERQKFEDGKQIRWQKPKLLLQRLFSPFVDKGNLIIDPFMGSGSSGEVAFELGCDYIGLEYDKKVFNLAKKRLDKIQKI